MELVEKFNQIIDDAYKSYQKEINLRLENWIDIQEGDIYEGTSLDDSGRIWTQEEFINKCKIDSEFSEKWGIHIEERELTPKERIELAGGKIQDKYPALVEMSLRVCDERDIPTKLITLTYNNETIESYEN
jgi:hypothetical protein